MEVYKYLKTLNENRAMFPMKDQRRHGSGRNGLCPSFIHSIPPSLSRLSGDGFPLARRQGIRPRLAALQAAEAPKRDSGGVLALVGFRHSFVIGIATGDIDHEFGELAGVAGTLA